MISLLLWLSVTGMIFSLVYFCEVYFDPYRFGEISFFALLMLLICVGCFFATLHVRDDGNRVRDELNYYKAVSPDKNYEVFLLNHEIEKIQEKVKHYESREQETPDTE